MYIGGHNGFHTMLRGRNRCDIYDPRTRPWFTSKIIKIINKIVFMN
jgi:hypothetical protein